MKNTHKTNPMIINGSPSNALFLLLVFQFRFEIYVLEETMTNSFSTFLFSLRDRRSEIRDLHAIHMLGGFCTLINKYHFKDKYPMQSVFFFSLLVTCKGNLLCTAYTVRRTGFARTKRPFVRQLSHQMKLAHKNRIFVHFDDVHPFLPVHV